MNNQTDNNQIQNPPTQQEDVPVLSSSQTSGGLIENPLSQAITPPATENTSDNNPNPPARDNVLAVNTNQYQNPPDPVSNLKKGSRKKMLITVLGIAFLIFGVSAGVFLVQRQQKLSQKAESDRDCVESQNCILLDKPQVSGTYNAPKKIKSAFFNSTTPKTYTPPGTTDDCYTVSISENRLIWSKTNSSCPEATSLQVWLEGTETASLFWSSELQCDKLAVKASAEHQAFGVSVYSGSDSTGWTEFESFLGESGGTDIQFFEITNKEPLVFGAVIKTKISYSGSIVYDNNLSYPDKCTAPPPITSITKTPQTGTPIPTIPKTAVSAQCSAVKAYDTVWNLLSASDLAELSEGEKVRFTVSGTSTEGSFDMAKFTINGVVRNSVTTKKPGTNEFFDEYTIPEEVYSFTVNAQIHHTILGWF